jgi:hypothetical protein
VAVGLRNIAIVVFTWGIRIQIIGLIIFAVYDHIVNEPKAAEMQKNLEDESRMIIPPRNANLSQYMANHKTSQALVTSEFRTVLSYSQLRDYYDTELERHDWRFYKEDNLLELSRDLGSKSRSYCKGEYRAELFYPGPGHEYGWNYSLGFSWGLGLPTECYLKVVSGPVGRFKVIKALFHLLWAIFLLFIGVLCSFWPKEIQRIALEYYDEHEWAARLNLFLNWMRTQNYIRHLRIVGAMAITISFYVFFLAFRGFQ